MFIDFFKEHYIACVVAILAISIMFYILTVVIIRTIKMRNQAKLEKMLTEIPIIPDEEVAVAEVVHENRRKGNAELIWIREHALGENTNAKEQAQIVEEQNESVKAEPKQTKSPTSKKTDKKAKKVEEKEKPAEKPAKKVVGKWVIREKGDGEFIAFLHASNGEIMLTSETYATADGARKGVSTIKKSVETGNFQLYCDKNANYYYKLKNAQNRFLCVGETYPTKSACLSAIDSVIRFAEAPTMEEVEKDITIINYEIPKGEEKFVENTAYAGKWVITDVDDMYIAQLFASNGELLLNSESYTTTASARAAIDTITSNGIAGNFIIDVDKKGRFYFKLRNDKKTTLCVGETYSQLSKCQNAVDSVRRFLQTAKLED